MSYNFDGKKIRRMHTKTLPLPISDSKRVTGSLATCLSNSNAVREHVRDHPDQKYVTISCQTVPYRVPNMTSSKEIIFGVLSNAVGNGIKRRKAIRDTWGRNNLVYFIVAGPWSDVASEYGEYGDLIWLDMDVLTYKTLVFMKVAHDSSILGTRFAFKTDDGSFIDVMRLHQELLETNTVRDYWGDCSHHLIPPVRGDRKCKALLKLLLFSRAM